MILPVEETTTANNIMSRIIVQTREPFVDCVIRRKVPLFKRNVATNGSVTRKVNMRLDPMNVKANADRNHRYGSICAYHHQEGHEGDWKECQVCVSDFHPFDYAVKASNQADSGTERRYNFDDNVRHDLDLSIVDFPTCHECDAPCDTTEETTRTLGMRKMMGGGKTVLQVPWRRPWRDC